MSNGPTPINVTLASGTVVPGSITDRSRFGICIAYLDERGHNQVNWFSPSTAVARARAPTERFYIDRFGAAVVGPP